MKQPDDQPSKAALAMSVGAVLTANILGGLGLGYAADRWGGTAPWGIIVGIILGTTSAFISLYRIMQKLQ
ncbi:MAG: AtpZ/AtpI family protein [Acidobacteria bacterium]|nr:AtpZ/AtpI family protein [Acidobacteriota bacterium]